MINMNNNNWIPLKSNYNQNCYELQKKNYPEYFNGNTFDLKQESNQIWDAVRRIWVY